MSREGVQARCRLYTAYQFHHKLLLALRACASTCFCHLCSLISSWIHHAGGCFGHGSSCIQHWKTGAHTLTDVNLSALKCWEAEQWMCALADRASLCLCGYTFFCPLPVRPNEGSVNVKAKLDGKTWRKMWEGTYHPRRGFWD